MIKKLSIIVPVFNEERTIGLVLERIFKQKLQGWRKEVIVVDDGSKDKTQEKLKPFFKKIKLLKHQINQGKGEAIQTGLRAVSGEAVIIQDADLEYNPRDWPNLLGALNDQITVVYGSRNLKPGRRGYPHYVVGDLFLTFLVNLLFGSQLTDLYTGYKLFRTQVIKSLSFQSRGFEFEVEVTCKIIKRGLKIKEVPIHYYPRRFSEGKKIRLWDGLVGFWTIIKSRFS